MEIMDASIVGLITSAICIFLLWKFLSCAVFPLLGNIILGGLLYYVINLLHIVHMPWSFLTLSLLLSSEFREPFSLRFSIFLLIIDHGTKNRILFQRIRFFYSKIQQLFILSIILSSHEPFPLYWVTSSPDTFA